MRKTRATPPFVRIPKHVDGGPLYAAALRLESKLSSAMPKIDRALHDLRPDYSQSEMPEAAEYWVDLVPGYWVQAFHRKAHNFLAYLQAYAYIIANAIPESRPDFANVRLLDFGGGSGLMSMLAKEAGIGYVTYLDINPGPAAVCEVVSEAVGLPLDEYICGSESPLYRNADSFDSVVTSDVLEHIYDLQSVFKALGHACAPGAFVFHQTGANPRNPWVKFTLSRLQRRHESDSPNVLDQLHADGVRAFWEIRKGSIKSQAPDIDEPDLDRLAKDTRGLNRSDLDRAIVAYRRSGSFPVPLHPTNTCDPITGQWLERMMDPDYVANELAKAGFRTRVMQCYWGPGRSPFPQRVAKHVLNLVSSVSVGVGLRATFYYGIQGIKCGG